MKVVGVIIMSVGFLAAAFVSVRHADSADLEWDTIEWSWYILAFAISLVGVVMLRLSAKATMTHSHKLEADLTTIHNSLESLVGKIQTINRHRDDLSVYDVSSRIDDQLMEDLGSFVDAREALIHQYDLQRYADLMSCFAASERSINRAWSASVDGYIDETWICMEKAEKWMSDANALLQTYRD